MNTEETGRRIARALKEAGAVSPAFEAAVILRFVLGVPQTWIMAHPDAEISAEDSGAIGRILARRLNREPLQYILGSWDFFGRVFDTPPGVLIPRPETELLVEKALELAPGDGGAFLDWGTGTGCIALSLLCESKGLTGVAADRSPRALITAWNNMKRHQVLRRCLLWHSRSPDDIPIFPASLDLFVSNPPYIKTGQLPALMPEVRFEPVEALDGGVDGLYWYERLFPAAERLLKPGGSLLLEIGDAEQAESLVRLAPPALAHAATHDDFSGAPRVLAWRRV